MIYDFLSVEYTCLHVALYRLEAEGTAGLTRRHGRAVLRGVSRALALQQGYMLAQIAE